MSTGMSKTHELKCHPAPFAAVMDGSKPFEWRKDDRGFQVGDTLHLKEWDPRTEPIEDDPLDGEFCQRVPIGYTGRELFRRVTYIIRDGFGIPPGYCIMGLTAATPGGIGAPAPGLTVEEAEVVVKAWVQKTSGCEDEDDWREEEWQKYVSDLRARLTAALTAKSRTA